MKKLTRSRDDRWIAGVCGGIAEYTGIDATVVRLVLVVCTILGAGSLIVGYVVAWVLMPRRDRHDTVSVTAADPVV
ncbi:PspC domain-containing protein [Aeromicrobium endophyticum]|uniref:PspC domain-containing protein n=1 Tax=Aeromicrobium endophyticum TaxID=2292704 RepID=A0A371P8P9_9ACTN|nr:PspC domain-containing protein [Aeromicrobium endophyticum]REK72311.1 PspC domain-containing protein [Aeromicrobium endophyticum]